MASDEIRVGDVGTVFQVTVKDDAGIVDLTLADTHNFIFKKPDNTTVVKVATKATPQTSGILTYASESAFLDAEGCWQLQVEVAFSGAGTSWKSDIGQFQVSPNL